jgi:hypothetical protein
VVMVRGARDFLKWLREAEEWSSVGIPNK